jgi:hypothetical protein
MAGPQPGAEFASISIVTPSEDPIAESVESPERLTTSRSAEYNLTECISVWLNAEFARLRRILIAVRLATSYVDLRPWGQTALFFSSVSADLRPSFPRNSARGSRPRRYLTKK